MNDQGINNTTIDNDTGGITWSFEDVAEDLKKPLVVNKHDILYSEPVILGNVSGISGSGEIVHNAVTIKNAKSWYVGIPDSLFFAANISAFVSKNVLELYGPEPFFNCEIALVVQRGLVEPQKSLRPRASTWHDHLKEGIQLSYQFCDALPTEIQTPKQQIVSAQPNQLIRLGSGINHRSQTNSSSKTTIRTWGNLCVYKHATRPQRGTPYNAALQPINIENALTPGQAASIGGNFTPAREPIPLFK